MTEIIARWADEEHTSISLVRDGRHMSVPNDMSNTDRSWLEENNITIEEWEAPPPSQADVELEQARRLAEGFDFDFGDARGVHHIGTDDKDMKGWSEVTTIAQALLNVGQPNQMIDILTNTGPVQVSAAEWQQVLLAAAQFRQPIFLGTFALLTQDPVPADYKTNDGYWDGSLQ